MKRAMASPLSNDLLSLGETLAERLGWPKVDGIHLPAPVDEPGYRDEFGFVFLSDGGIGPFYVSLGDLPERLRQRHPNPAAVGGDSATMLQPLAAADPVDRALAVGVYNALSASLYTAATYRPAGRRAAVGPPGTGRVGMVGYFGSLVERLAAQGQNVLVLEQVPERVPVREGVDVTTEPAALRACDRILCTASTLINDSLDGLLSLVGPGTTFELVGPTGSGLPDPLFARGVGSIGGILFDDRETLLSRLADGESWGDIGRKFEIGRDDYPGADALFSRLARR